MYKRPDGLYEKVLTIDGVRLPPFRAKTEREVLQKIAAYKGKVERGRLFKDVAEEWEQIHYEEISYGTAKSYKTPCRRAIEHFGYKSIKDIAPNGVNAFIVAFSKKKYSQKTVKNLLLVCNLIFSHSVLQGDIQFCPTAHIKVPKNLPKARRDMPNEQDIQIVKDSIDCTFGIFAYFLLYTGCHNGEALTLQYKDIDYTRNMIR